MNKRRIVAKRIAAWFLCIALVMTTINLSAFTTKVKAAGAGYDMRFYYGTAYTSIRGGAKAELASILGKLGINGDVSDAVSSDETCFEVTEEDGGWYVTSKYGFGDTKSLTVTVDGEEYKIWTQCLPDSMDVVITDEAEFDPNGGTGTMEGLKGPNKNNLLYANVIIGRPYVLPECGFTAPDGMEFAGWEIDGEVYEAGYPFTFKSTSSFKVKATWKDIEATDDVEENIRYEFPECGPMLLGMGWVFNRFNTVYVQNDEHPEGEYLAFEITGVRVETLEGEDVVECYDNDYYIWNIECRNLGHVKIYMDYNTYDGTPVETPYEVDLYVTDAVYTGWIELEGQDIMLPGSQKDICVNLHLEGYDPENGYFGKDYVDDSEIRVEWEIAEETDDGNLVIIPSTDSLRFARIESKADAASAPHEYRIRARIYVTDGNGEFVEATSCEVGVRVQSLYYSLELTEPHKSWMGIGDSETLLPMLYKYEVGKAPIWLTSFDVDGETYPLEIQCEYDDKQIAVSVDQFGNVTIERTNIHETNFSIVIGYYADGIFQEIARREFWMDNMESYIWFDGRREGGKDWNFIDAEIYYPLDISGISKLNSENITIEYQYGFRTEEGYVGITTNLDEYLTMDGICIPASMVSTIKEEISEAGNTNWLWVRAAVLYNGIEVCSDYLDIELKDVVYEYHYPNMRNGVMLPGWDEFLDSNFECFVQNADHPDGENIWLHIDSIKVEEIGDSENVFDWEDGEGWTFYARNCGGVTITIYYTPVDGSDDSGEYSFDVWVAEKAYDLWINPLGHTNLAVPGEEIILNAFMNRYEADGRMDSMPGELDEQIRLEWGFGEGSENVENYWVDEYNQRNFHVCAADLDYDYSILVWVRAYEEDGSECAYAEFRISVIQAYYSVELGDYEDFTLDIGESITVIPELWRHEAGRTPEIVTDVAMDGEIVPIGVEWEYDSEAVSITDNGDGSYLITRLQNWDTDITLHMGILYEGEDYDYVDGWATKDYHLNRVEYEIRFENMMEEYWTKNFVDQDMNYPLNLGKLQGLDQNKLSYQFVYGYWDDEICEVAPIDINLDQYLSKDGIQIPASLLPALREEILTKSDYGTEALEIDVYVFYDGEMIAETWTEISIVNNYYDYFYPSLRDGVLLRGWNEHLDPYFECNMENAEHPYGDTMMVHIDAVEVETIEGEEPIVFEQDGENGWNFHAKNYGCARITIYYTPVDGSDDSGEYSFDVYVVSELFEVNIDTSNHSNLVLQGSELALQAFVTHYYDDGRVERFPGELDEQIRVEWNIIDDWGMISDFRTDELGCFFIQPSETDGEYEVWVGVDVYAYTEDGEEYICAHKEISINAVSSYWEVRPYDLDNYNLEVGESVTVVPELWFFQCGCDPEHVLEVWDEDGREPIVVEWGYDDSAVEITDNGDGSYTITKLTNCDTDILLRMGPMFFAVNDDDEEVFVLYEHANRTYHLNHVGCGDNHRFVPGEDGNTHVCEECGIMEDHYDDDEDGFCDVCGEHLIPARIQYSHTLTLQSDITLNYYVSADDLVGLENVTLHVEKDVYSKSGEYSIKETTLIGELVTSSVGREYKFRYTGIAAYEAGNEVRAYLTAEKDGKVYEFNVDTYSVKTYCYNQLAKDSVKASLKELLVDFLNYASTAQEYFGIRANALVNAELTDAQRALGGVNEKTLNRMSDEVELKGATAEISGKTLVLNNTVELKIYMKLPEKMDKTGVTLKLQYVNISGKTVTKEIPFSEFAYTSSSKEYSARYNGFLASEFRSVVSISICNNGQQISNLHEYSIETYAYNRVNSDSSTNLMKELVKAMMMYSDSAVAYLKK